MQQNLLRREQSLENFQLRGEEQKQLLLPGLTAGQKDQLSRQYLIERQSSNYCTASRCGISWCHTPTGVRCRCRKRFSASNCNNCSSGGIDKTNLRLLPTRAMKRKGEVARKKRSKLNSYDRGTCQQVLGAS